MLSEQFCGGGVFAETFPREPCELKVVTVQSDLSSAIVLDTSGYLIAQNQGADTAQDSGHILELHIDEGTKVKKGDLLIQLDAKELAADLAAVKGLACPGESSAG